ncbi:MAG: hypothetical protein QOJ03_1674 [Frankiaceae bacterium]|nr:hypothetical protein [Frankiaceae bacterium]
MNPRLHTLVFVGLCLAGVVAAVALTVREVGQTAPVALSVTETTRTADTTLVAVSVRNTTSTARCVSVRVAARDRAGHDLTAVTAVRALRLPAHAHRTVSAALTLTRRQYAEQLHGFYPSERPCASG